MYNDYYLRFPDEATFRQFHDMSDPDNPVTLGDGYFVDEIGLIYKPTGETTTDEDGFEVPKMMAVEGWHVNVRSKLSLPEELLVYQIPTPITPERGYA